MLGGVLAEAGEPVDDAIVVPPAVGGGPERRGEVVEGNDRIDPVREAGRADSSIVIDRRT